MKKLNITIEIINNMQNYYDKGVSIIKVANKYNMSSGSVRKYIKTRPNKVKRINLTCGKCNNNFSTIKSRLRESKSGKHFCSQSCAASYNNLGIKRNKPKVKNCLNCNKIIVGTSNIYCDINCFHSHNFDKNLKLFKQGLIKWNSTIKKFLIHLQGEKCIKCKLGSIWQEENIVLEVDHIDGNSDNCLPNNLRLLCPNCHSQTPTSRGKNKRKDTRRNKYLRKYKGY